jgi:hypothetical protein
MFRGPRLRLGNDACGPGGVLECGSPFSGRLNCIGTAGRMPSFCCLEESRRDTR